MAPLLPRREAQPRKFSDLSQSQQRAVAQVHEWLSSFLASAHASHRASLTNYPFLPRIDLQRPSNVLLIDGERGSGKTEVLVSLLALWSARFEEPAAALQRHKESFPEEIREPLDNGTLIPIPFPVLDLQPLPRGSTLLMQLATRLHRLVDTKATTARATKDRPPPFFDGSRESAAAASWRKLVRAAASAEPQASAPRALSPEDVAEELEQGERERTGLIESWVDFVDEVIKAAPSLISSPSSVKTERVCLVLPIDDADMNPSRCVELLELIRSLWHRQVVFLLTGHTNLFRECLDHYFAKADCTAQRATRLARQFLDKVIPPRQRLQVSADVPAARRILTASKLPQRIEVLLNEFSELQAAVPNQWRTVLDLGAEIHANHSSSEYAALAFFRAASAEVEFLVEDWKQIEQRAVRVEASSSSDPQAKLRLVVDDGYFELQPALRAQSIRIDQSRVQVIHQRESPHEPSSSHLFLKRELARERKNNLESTAALPASIEAALFLASIVADESGRRMSRELTPAGYRFVDTKVEAGAVMLRFPWPTPEWGKTIDFLRFRDRWERLLNSPWANLLAGSENDSATRSQRRGMSKLTYGFLDLLCSAAEASEDPPADHPEPEESSPDWEALAKRLVDVGRSPNTTRHLAAWARAGALVLVWPEYALDQVDQQSLLRHWLRWQWRYRDSIEKYLQAVNEISRERASILEDVAHRQNINSADRFDVLVDAVIEVRKQNMMGLMFEYDQKDANDAKKRFSTTPEERRSLIREQVLKLINSLDLQVDKENSEILGGPDQLPSPTKSIEYHLKDRMTHIGVICEKSSSTSLGENHNLHYYFTRHGNSIFTDPNELDLDLLLGREMELFSDLVDSLDRFIDKRSPDVSIQAAKLIIREFSRALSRPTPETAIESLLSVTVQPPQPAKDDQKTTIKTIPSIPKLNLVVSKHENDDWAYRAWSNEHPEIQRHLSTLHDIIVDQEDLRLEIKAESLSLLCFVPQMRSAYPHNDKILFFPCIEPAWINMWEKRMMVANYGVIASQILPRLSNDQAPTPLTAYGIATLICANRALYRHPNWDGMAVYTLPEIWNKQRLGDPPYAITISREHFGRLKAASFRGRRWQAVMAWANYGAPLYAAPESGMSEEEANEWLHIWADSLEVDRDQLKAVRRHRAKLALRNAGLPDNDDTVEGLLLEIDAHVPTHPWVRLIECRPPLSTQSASSPREDKPDSQAAPGSKPKNES